MQRPIPIWLGGMADAVIKRVGEMAEMLKGPPLGGFVPLGAKLMALTPISAFRPRRWHGALLPDTARVTIEILEAEKRPVNAVADHVETKNVLEVVVEMDHDTSIQLLHDPGHSLDERILREQFGVEVLAYVKQVQKIIGTVNPEKVKLKDVESNIVRCPDAKAAAKMLDPMKSQQTMAEVLAVR